jgi:hypothetical protein
MKRKLLFWELKEGMYVGVNVSTRTALKRNDGEDDDDMPLKLNGRFVGVVTELSNEKATIRLAQGGSIVVFNTGYLSTKDNKTFPYDVDEITEAQYLIEKV